MSDIIYRGPGPWGAGQGSNLTAGQVDDNFYLLYSMIQAAQDHGNGAGIDYFVVTGNQIYIHLTNHQVEGPYTLPVAQFNFRFGWTANTLYNPMDVFTYAGAVYLTLVENTESAFNASLIIDGQQVYALMLAEPTLDNLLPTHGSAGQVLQLNGNSPNTAEWVTPTRNIALFVEGSPESGELLLQYLCPESMTLPQDLIGSLAYSNSAPNADVEFSLYKNAVFIGSINFTPSPDNITVSFPHAVSFVSGDILTLYAPENSSADSHMTNISFTLIAYLEP